MKMVLFIGEVSPDGVMLKKFLEESGYKCALVDSVDEIDQVGKQVDKAILVFTGSKLPYKFLTDNSWPFPTMNILFVATKPTLSPEMEKKNKRMDLVIYYHSIKNELIIAIEAFLNNESESEDLGEIQFTVTEHLSKVKR